MSRFFRSLYSIFIILALMTSCEMFDNSPGSFLISFEWPKDGKPDFSAKKYFVWVLLEEWKDGDKDNATLLMQTSAVEFDSNGKAKIDLSDVKYGDNRVVKVEIRATNKTQDRVLYFGRSELFSFSSKDKDKVVNVELQTQATPGTGGTGTDSFSLQIMQGGNVVTKINDTTVDVRIKIVNGSRVIIANSLSLLEKYINDKNSVSEGVADKALSELKAGEAGYYDLESWDLNSGLDFAADAGGERIVYGKLVNDDGYMSETVQTSVNVDKAAPAIINPVVDPNPAKLGDTVVASFSFTEPVDMNALELDWGGLEFVQAESESSNVFTYTFKVTETTGEKTYSLKGSAVDEIGNGPVEFALGDLRIDKTLPSISNETVSVTDNKSSIKTGDKVTVTFEVSEELESDPEVTIDGKKFTRNGTSDKPYSFTYTVTNSDAEGLKTVLVSLSDLARNRNVIEIGETVKFDLSSPEIINPTVTPSGDPGMAGLGNKIEIRFNISEPVKELKFFVNGTDNSVSGLFTESVKDLTYTYTRTVQPSEAASEYVFSVFALDPALNALENFELGTVSVDIEKPDVESFVLSTTNVKLMEEFSLSLDFSEELSSLAVLVGSKDISAGCIPDNLDKKKYLCGHQANKDSDEGDGVKQFSVQMVDKSGNSNTVQLKKEGGAPATIEYDVTPPEVVNPVIAPEKANLDSTIDVRFSFTENVQNLVVDWGDLAGKFTRFNEETNQKLFIYKRKVTSDDPEGVFPVVITAAQDLAGNSIAGNIAIGSVEIDNSAPEIFNSSVKVNGSALRVFVVENDLIEVSFEVHEEISDYSVRSGLKKIESCVSEAVAEGTKYTCTYSTPSSDDGEGLKDVTVEVKDIAGNSATYPVGQLTYDMSLPQLSSAIVIPEKVNSSSSVVKVQFSFSEDVQIQIDEVFIVPENLGADLPLNCDTGADYKKSFTCLHTFSELDSRVENYIVSVKVRDKAGNQIDELFIGKVSVDREKPYLTASDINPSAVRQSEPFTISFAVNEDLETMPVVKIGDKEISGSECAEISARNYSCTHTANGDGGETDGVKSVTVNLRDSAGNLSIITLSKNVTYDATRPELLNPVIIPEGTANRYNSLIQVRFSFSEKINYPASFNFLTVSSKGGSVPVFNCSPANANNQSFTCQATFSDEDQTVDTFTFKVSASDLAGNELSAGNIPVEIGTLNVDRSNPDVVFEPVSPSVLIASSTQLTVIFTVSENLKENPVVKIGSEISSNTPSSVSGLRYTYVFNDLTALSDGEKAISVKVTDIAGNSYDAVYSSTLTVDRTEPVLVSSSVAPSVVNKDTNQIVVSFTFSEKMTALTNSNVTVTPAGLPAHSCITADNQSYSCTVNTSSLGTDKDNTYTYSVSGSDTNGNPIGSIVIGSVLVDRTDAVISFVSVTPAAVKAATGSVTIVFDVNETLGTNPVVSIGSELSKNTPTSVSGLRYTYVFSDLSSLSDGSKTVKVYATDSKGNSKETPYVTPVVVDKTPPALLAGTVAPSIANSETVSVAVSFAFSEKIDSFVKGDVTVVPAGILTNYVCTNSSGDEQTYSCVFDTTALGTYEGLFTFYAAAEDKAGNPMAVNPSQIGVLTVDRNAPELTFNSVTPATVNKAVTSVSVQFTVDEVPDGNPVVKIGTEISKNTPSSVTNGGKTFIYVFSDLTGVSDGNKNVFVDLKDGSGNIVSATWAGVIKFDRTSPEVISSSVAPAYVNKTASTLDISFSFSEPMSAFSNTYLTVSPAGILPAHSCTALDGSNQTITCTINTSGINSSADNFYTFTVTGTDSSGNAMVSPHTLGFSTVDRTAPDAALNSITPLTVNRNSTTVTVIFTVTETLAANPVVKIGSEKSLTVPNSVSGKQYTYIFNDLSGITDGPKTITAQIKDIAGNTVAKDFSGLFFDRTLPGVVSSSVSPSVINKDVTQLKVSFTFNEKMTPIINSNVTVVPAGKLPAHSCSSPSSDNQSFECIADVSSLTSTADGGYVYYVQGTDVNGNVMSAPVSVGSTFVDRTVPTVTLNLLTPATVNSATASVSVVFTLSETPESNPVVKLGTTKQSSTPSSVSGLQYTYIFNDLSGITDGDKTINISAKDLRGNTVSTDFTGPLFDRTLPSVISSSVAPAVINKSTGSLTISFTFNEKMTPIVNADVTVSPTGKLPAHSCLSPSGDNQSFSCTVDVSSLTATADGSYTYSVIGTDFSGNQISAPVTVGSTRVDRTDPNASIVSILVYDQVTNLVKSPQIARAGDYIIAQFTLTETLIQNPVLMLGGRVMTKIGGDCLSGTCNYRQTVLSTDGDGSKTLSIELKDVAGNVNAFPYADAAVFDVTAPTMHSYSLSPIYAKEGSELDAKFSFSEPVHTSSMLISSTIPFTKDTGVSTDSTFLYKTYVESSTPEGNVQFQVKARDAAGNWANSGSYLTVGNATVDRTTPLLNSNTCSVTVSSGYTNPAGIKAVKAGQTVTANCNITANETITGNPVLKVGGYTATRQGTCPGGYNNCFVYTVLGTEGDGNKMITTEVTDLSGNITTGSTGQQVAFDFTPPQLVYDMIYRTPDLPGSTEGTTVHVSAYHPVSRQNIVVTFQLFADEHIDPLTAQLTSSPEGFNPALVSVAGNIVEFEKTVQLSNSGIYTFNLTWKDMLGNTSGTIYLTWNINADNTATSAADLNMDLIRFTKVPYGSEDTGGLPRYILTGDPGAVTDSTISNIAAYTLSGSIAGQATVQTDGSFSIPNMSSGNVSEIFINPIRKSGASMMPAAAYSPVDDFVQVEKIKYIATMGYKTAGSDLNNPNDWYITKNTSYSISLSGENASVPADGNLLSRIDGLSLESGTTSKWVLNTESSYPDPLAGGSICYDSARGRIVLFGGADASDRKDSTWEWYDGKWNNAVFDDPEGDGEPVPASYGQMTYDNRRKVCVYYGGGTSSGILNKTWEWNGRSWQRIWPSDPENDGNADPIMTGAMAYDTHRGVSVVAAGASGGANGTTFEFDGNSWLLTLQQSAGPTGPGVAMAYDRSRRVMVLAGGSNQGDKTYEYTGQRWIQVCGTGTACSGLPAKEYGMMAYDAKRKVVVYFGGQEGGVRTNTIYEWNGTAWTLKSPAGDIPAIRRAGSMVYHEGRQTVVLFGGSNGSTYYNDTWEWDGTKWTRLSPANIASAPVPTMVKDYAIGYDPSRKVAILHGGVVGTGTTVSSETWEWNGYGWKKLSPATTLFRYGHTMAYDSSAGRLLMFGGMDNVSAYHNEVYEWNGTDWAIRTLASGSAPAGRKNSKMVYDSVKNRMIVFGGETAPGVYTRQTYEWNNSARTWLYASISGPEARVQHGMVYDPVKQRTILWGGTDWSLSDLTGFGDTWEYNSATYGWTKVVTNPWTWGGFPSCPYSDSYCWNNGTATQSPMPRWGHLMVYDPKMRKTIVSGGLAFLDYAEGNELVMSDTWIYDSALATWAPFNPVNKDAFSSRTAILFHNGFYDSTKDEVVSWGGHTSLDNPSIYNNVQTLRTGAAEVPSQLFKVGLDTVGLTEDLAWRDISSISLSVYAGATVLSGTNCAAVNGVVLYGWANDRWLMLDQSPAPKSAVTQMTFSVNKPEIIQELLSGEASELHFKIEAKGPAGCVNNDDALLAVDYAEITVDMKEDSILDRYYVSTSSTTWADARTACNSMGMDLAVINSQKESELVYNMLNTGRLYWIGLNVPSVDGDWRWVNGLQAWSGGTTGYGLSWTKWYSDAATGALYRPATVTVGTNCATMYYVGGKWQWYDLACTQNRYYVCEKRDYSYSGVTGYQSANESACVSNGGHLTSINSELEEDAIWPYVASTTNYQYIGLKNPSDSPQIYTWSDGDALWDGGSTGTAYGYSHWYSGEPAGGECVTYIPGFSNRNWYDLSCYYDYFGGICEY